jgi:tripartite ATP-independent transporter DctP family solute receptor
VAALAVFVVTACGGRPAANEVAPDPNKVYHFRLAGNTPIGQVATQSAQDFADQVKKETNGKVIFEVFPNFQLGSEEVELPSIISGSIDAGQLSNNILSTVVPESGVLGLAFLFPTADSEKKVIDGPVGKRLEAALEKTNLHVLGWWYNGSRNVMSTKAINTVNDFGGLKIRTPSSPTSTGLFQALGAAPAPLAYNELYAAMQSGVVNALEIPTSTLLAGKWYEVAKYYATTDHQRTVVLVTINTDKWKSLPAQYQRAIEKVIKKVTADQWVASKADDEAALGGLKAKGVIVTKPDHAALVAKTQNFNATFAAKIGATELLAQIVKEVGS